MKLKPIRFYEARANIAKALAHPSRLLILDALKARELCVCELTPLARLDQSTVSKHLAVLKTAGLIAVRKEGTMSYYRITVGCLDSFFGCLESVLHENLRIQQELVEGLLRQSANPIRRQEGK